MATKKTENTETKVKTVTIQLPYIEGKENYVMVGSNMKTYQIKRGEPVEVPEDVAEILANSDRQMMIARENQEKMTSKSYGEM